MHQLGKTPASAVALGGVLAALAITCMCLGGLIPVATFVTPMLCMLMLQTVLNTCSARIGWAWYGAVSILSILLAPDKEAASVFVFLGYYPIVKPYIEQVRFRFLAKLVLFNTAILIMYALLLKIFGLTELSEEFVETSRAMTVLLLILGNTTFLLLDKLLSMEKIKRLGKNVR